MSITNNCNSQYSLLYILKWTTKFYMNNKCLTVFSNSYPIHSIWPAKRVSTLACSRKCISITFWMYYVPRESSRCVCVSPSPPLYVYAQQSAAEYFDRNRRSVCGCACECIFRADSVRNIYSFPRSLYMYIWHIHSVCVCVENGYICKKLQTLRVKCRIYVDDRIPHNTNAARCWRSLCIKHLREANVVRGF